MSWRQQYAAVDKRINKHLTICSQPQKDLVSTVLPQQAGTGCLCSTKAWSVATLQPLCCRTGTPHFIRAPCKAKSTWKALHKTEHSSPSAMAPRSVFSGQSSENIIIYAIKQINRVIINRLNHKRSHWKRNTKSRIWVHTKLHWNVSNIKMRLLFS